MGRRLLIIRFSAIGDLLLTAPVLQCLASCGHDLTLVVKRSHKSAAEVLPGVDEQLIWEDAQAGLIEHGKGRYDAVIDLQGTYQSKQFTRKLGLPVSTFHKPYLKRWLLLITKSPSFKISPVVERYAHAASPWLEDRSLPTKLSFRLPENESIKNALVLVIGGTQVGKRLSLIQWQELISNIAFDGNPMVLLGGRGDQKLAHELCAQFDHLIDATSYSIASGLSLIKNAALVVSGDTGFMHAASLLDTPLVSFWGATHPNLGFAPWPVRSSQKEVMSKSIWTPMSKHGKKLIFLPNPMNKLPVSEVLTAIEQMLQDRTTP